MCISTKRERGVCMCEYCTTDRDGYVSSIKPTNHVKGKAEIKSFIRYESYNGYVLDTRFSTTNSLFKINFCPMCGRNLRDRSC